MTTEKRNRRRYTEDFKREAVGYKLASQVVACQPACNSARVMSSWFCRFCFIACVLRQRDGGDQTLYPADDVREYVAVYYNAKRLHSTLGYKTPLDFEKKLNKVSENS